MDADQIAALVPGLLQARYPGTHREAEPAESPAGSAWVLEHEDAVCLIRATRTGKPFVWLLVGVAVDIPRSSELAYYVACANQQLEVGRAYMGYGERFAMVVVDETVFASSLSWEFEPSIHDLITRLEGSITHAGDLGVDILKRFGGRRFTRDDVMHMGF